MYFGFRLGEVTVFFDVLGLVHSVSTICLDAEKILKKKIWVFFYSQIVKLEDLRLFV